MEAKLERNIWVGSQLSPAKNKLCHVVLWMVICSAVHLRTINPVDSDSVNLC